ncbi:hypothetical protein RJ640_009163 [Escallonia rubra]|uniref:AP2/ERF domain-containing protein n=1 Tax=Escallonia rubra TaxID=112253 RepID=A0AA88SAD4_9ASTE|nr:hypothetical protein RJ640_009163 [Escallonia rubra]
MVRPAAQGRRERRDAANSGGRYKGVRMRKWGKWVAEVRRPNSRDRIWLGSYETPVEAARAYDAAVFCLRGPSAMLNFPADPPDIPAAGELLPPQIQVAASRHARSVPVGTEEVVGGVPTEFAGDFFVSFAAEDGGVSGGSVPSDVAFYETPGSHRRGDVESWLAKQPGVSVKPDQFYIWFDSTQWIGDLQKLMTQEGAWQVENLWPQADSLPKRSFTQKTPMLMLLE